MEGWRDRERGRERGREITNQQVNSDHPEYIVSNQVQDSLTPPL